MFEKMYSLEAVFVFSVDDEDIFLMLAVMKSVVNRTIGTALSLTGLHNRLEDFVSTTNKFTKCGARIHILPHKFNILVDFCNKVVMLRNYFFNLFVINLPFGYFSGLTTAGKEC